MNSQEAPSVLEQLTDLYGYILEPELLEKIVKVGTISKVKQGDKLMDIGDYIVSIPLLIDGALKIMRDDNEGNELLLYYLETGDTCTMSFTCCFGAKKSKIRAVAEDDSILVMVPIEYLDKWLLEYSGWKEFVFESFETRMAEFLEAVESVAFMKMDERLLKYLRDKAKVNGSSTLHATHKEIAQDLHTSRVVVSRLLKKLENEKIISMGRNRLEVLKF